MFKRSTVIVAFFGIIASVLLLAALTGENASSRMEAFPVLSGLYILLPSVIPDVPSVPAIPTFLPTRIPSIIPVPVTQVPAATPVPATQVPGVPPETIPGIIRVTPVPTPTPAATVVVTVTSTPAAPVTNVSPSPTITGTIEQTLPMNWIVLAIIIGIAVLLIVLGTYDIFRGKKK